MRRYRQSVQYNTIQCFKNGYYEKNEQIIIIPEKLVQKSIESTIKMSAPEINNLYSKFCDSYNKKQKMELIEDDCLKVGLHLKNQGFNPVVLNMANPFRSGGGYLHGANAQEESLFRRTNLFMCLHNKLYPIPLSGTIYTKNAVVLTKDEFNNYEYLNEPETISFIAAAAWRINKKDLIIENGEQKLNSKIENITKRTMHSIFRTAINNGHDCIVLSAFGCGAFGNPPKHIAYLFKQVILEGQYNKKLKIVFAIFDDKNAFDNNKNGNIKFFRQIIIDH